MARRLQVVGLTRAGLEGPVFITALTLGAFTIFAGSRPVASPVTLILAGFSANRKVGTPRSQRPVGAARRLYHLPALLRAILEFVHQGFRLVGHLQELRP